MIPYGEAGGNASQRLTDATSNGWVWAHALHDEPKNGLIQIHIIGLD